MQMWPSALMLWRIGRAPLCRVEAKKAFTGYFRPGAALSWASRRAERPGYQLKLRNAFATAALKAESSSGGGTDRPHGGQARHRP
jgi:hypothetical protein